jgi:hypothetical protein
MKKTTILFAVPITLVAFVYGAVELNKKNLTWYEIPAI